MLVEEHATVAGLPLADAAGLQQSLRRQSLSHQAGARRVIPEEEEPGSRAPSRCAGYHGIGTMIGWRRGVAN